MKTLGESLNLTSEGVEQKGPCGHKLGHHQQKGVNKVRECQLCMKRIEVGL